MPDHLQIIAIEVKKLNETASAILELLQKELSMPDITIPEKIAIMELALQGRTAKEPSLIAIYKQMLKAITASDAES